MDKKDRKYEVFFLALSIMIFGMFIYFVYIGYFAGHVPQDESQAAANPPVISVTPDITASADIIDIPDITTEELAEPDEPEITEYRITFTGTGDNVIHPCLWMDAKNRAVPGGREYNFKPVFGDVADMIAGADIAFINQETPMAGEGFELSGYPMFNSPQDLGHDLVELGFDVINIANNHMLDKGQRGLINTANFLRSLGVTVIGDYLNGDELYQIKTVERGGIKIAFLAYTYSTNGVVLPAGSEIIIPYIGDELILSQVEKAKSAADAVIISIHWGDEDSFRPNAEQKRVAQLMADSGVLAIIGHHPHVLQPIEWLERKDGGRTLCVYSLGNFASGMMRPMNMIGGFIGFDIVKRGSLVELDNPVFTPTIYYYGQGWLNGHAYLLESYTPALALAHGTFTRHGYSRSVDELREYVTKNISAEFLR